VNDAAVLWVKAEARRHVGMARLSAARPQSGESRRPRVLARPDDRGRAATHPLRGLSAWSL